MSDEITRFPLRTSTLESVKEIAIRLGYRFEVGEDGDECMYAPDGRLCLTAFKKRNEKAAKK